MRNRVAAVALCVVALAVALPLDRVAMAGEKVADELMAREKGVWDAWAKGDIAELGKQMHEKTISVTSGALTSGRENVISSYKEAACEVDSFLLEGMKAHHINENTVILTYKAQQDATCAGVKLDPKLLATSVWVRDGGEWLVASYQETPVTD
jgi:hypothetical protein